MIHTEKKTIKKNKISGPLGLLNLNPFLSRNSVKPSTFLDERIASWSLQVGGQIQLWSNTGQVDVELVRHVCLEMKHTIFLPWDYDYDDRSMKLE